METKLEHLIEKIKKDGINEAKKLSEEIISNANKEASKIIEDSKKESAKIIEEARAQSQRFQAMANTAVKQAARDSILSVREKLISVFDGILKREISSVMTTEFLKELIANITKRWFEQKGGALEILVNPQEKQKLEQFLFNQLRQQLHHDAQKNIEIKATDDISRGFRIVVKGENIFYDFSGESLLELLRQFLIPSVSALFNETSSKANPPKGV